MPEEPDRPSDAERLMTGIAGAVRAYGTFRRELADTVEPLVERWTSFTANLTPMFEQGRQLAEAVKKAQTAWLEAIAECSATASAALEALAREIAEAGPFLRRTLARADHVGSLGWTVTMDMSAPDMVQLSLMQRSYEADSYMQSWYQASDALLTHMEADLLAVPELEVFCVPLTQCFSAFRREEYAISISFLVATLEGAIRNVGPTERFFVPKIETTVKGLYDKAREDDPDAIEVFVWMSLYAFVHWFYEQYGQRNAGEPRPFRHGIQHGTQPPKNEKVEVLRLLHALKTVADLNRIRFDGKDTALASR